MITQQNHFLETFSGRRPVIGQMTKADVDIHDIFTSLSRIPRFLGHTNFFYSVAEHSVIVAQALEALGAEPEMVLAGLLHDAKEAYIGDMPTPVKNALKDIDPGFAKTWKELEHNTDQAICDLMSGLVTPEMFHDPILVGVDIGLLVEEARVLIASGGNGWGFSVMPTIIPESVILGRPYWGMEPSVAFIEISREFLRITESMVEAK